MTNLEDMLKAVELNDPGHALSADDVEQLTADATAMDACRTLFCARVVTDKTGDALADSEWERLKNRHQASRRATRRRRIVRITTWLAAACVVAAAGFFLINKASNADIEGKGIALVSTDKIKNVTLQNDNGSSLSLGSAVSKSKLDAFQAVIDANGQLVYRQKATADDEDVQMQAISTPKGKDFNFILSDGTHVWLNGGSHIEYPSRFDGGERAVRLTGEAYFSVAKDAAHPFIIRSGRMETRVLGTQLNVCDYDGRPSAVTLVTGSAEVSSNKNMQSYVRLRPGQNAELERDGNIKVRNVDTSLYTAWKDGFFSFDDITLGETIRRIADWYGVNVVFDRPELTRLRLRYYNERNVPLADNISTLNSFGTFRVELKGRTLHVR